VEITARPSPEPYVRREMMVVKYEAEEWQRSPFAEEWQGYPFEENSPRDAEAYRNLIEFLEEKNPWASYKDIALGLDWSLPHIDRGVALWRDRIGTQCVSGVIRFYSKEDEEFLEQTRKRGHEQGRKWAEQAERVILRRLRYFLPEMPDPYVVHYLIELKEYETDEEAAQAFKAWWNQVLGDGGAELVEEGWFLDGFIEGALEVWEEVKDKW
jgi:hypothetical protein